MLAIRDEPDPRRSVAMYAQISAGFGERISAMYEVFRAAANTDPEIRAQWEQIQAERLAGSRRFVDILAGKDLDPEEAGDVVWAYIDASLYPVWSWTGVGRGRASRRCSRIHRRLPPRVLS